MQIRYVLMALLGAMMGCSQQKEVIPNQAAAQPPAAVNQIDAAKAHAQQHIDRLMGGDQTVKVGLLGLAGVDFNSIESIEITSVVAAFSTEGKKLDDVFRVKMNVRGFDALKRRTVEQNITRDLTLKDGEWKFLQTSL